MASCRLRGQGVAPAAHRGVSPILAALACPSAASSYRTLGREPTLLRKESSQPAIGPEVAHSTGFSPVRTRKRRVRLLHSSSRAPHQRDVEMHREQKYSRVPCKEQHLGHRAENGFFDIAHTSLSGLLIPCRELGNSYAFTVEAALADRCAL